jgi:peptidoglycan/LPS O-acetylase OafA/YrhL
MEKPAPHNVAIDALRGFSILSVMVLHSVAPFPDFLRKIPAASAVALNGFYGVTIFFVISGFLISSNVIRRNGALSKIRIDQFYAMRVGRIMPCLILFLGLYFALLQFRVAGFVPSPVTLFYGGVKNLFELQYGSFYLTRGNVPGMYPFSPLWSLSIEETFYLLFPIVCFLLKSDAVIVYVAAGLTILGPFMRPDLPSALLFWGAVDLLAMGCIAAKIVSKISENKNIQWQALPLITVGSAAIAYSFIFFPSREHAQWSVSVVGIGTALFLIGASFQAARKKTEGRVGRVLLLPLAFLGRMSLQLYVFHVMVRVLVGTLINRYLLFSMLLIAAWCLGRWFLDPMNIRIRSFYKPGTDASTAPPSASIAAATAAAGARVRIPMP